MRGRREWREKRRGWEERKKWRYAYKINEDREEMKMLITCLSIPALIPPLLVPVKQELKSPWYIKGETKQY